MAGICQIILILITEQKRNIMELNKQLKGNDMPRKSVLLELPDELLKEFHSLIREYKYANFRKLLEWLEAKGYKSSKTAVHRYVATFKRYDGLNCNAGGFAMNISLNEENGGDLKTLFRQLGELEYRKQEILTKIREITEH